MELSYHLFLDDFRHPYDAFNIWKDTDYLKLKWIVVQTHEEFVNTITNKFSNDEWPAIISLDHDLADEHYEIGEKTGYKEFDYSLTIIPTGFHSAQWLIQFCKENNLDLPKFKVHSQSTVGRENITSILEEFVNSKK